MSDRVKVPVLTSSEFCRWDPVGANMGLVSNVLTFRPADGTARSLVTTIDTQTLTNKTLTSPTISAPTLTSVAAASTGVVLAQTGLFTEDASSTSHTLTFSLPAGSIVLDIIVTPQVLWTATGAVTLKVGDAADDDGWFTGVNLKATDLLVGERLQAASDNFWGGKNGVYLTTAGRFGQQSADMIGGYNPNAYSVIGVVTVATPATTAGRTRMTVLYMTGTTVTPVSA